MLNIRKALKNLDRQIFDGVELREALEKVLGENQIHLPPEFTVEDVFDLACQKRLIKPAGDGEFKIRLQRRRYR